MNPLTNVRKLAKLNERELSLGIAGHEGKSWHQKYKDSAWIFIGGLPYDLCEGDIVCVFSQYGEVVNINLIRDRKTGKSKGYGFVCFEDQRSTVLSVDNMNGIKLLGRIIRVDHVEEYRVPKERGDEDVEIRKLWHEGCAPKPIINVHVEEEEKETQNDLLLPLKNDPITSKLKKKVKKEKTSDDESKIKSQKKEKKEKKKKRKKKEKHRRDSSSSSSSDESPVAKKRRGHEEPQIKLLRPEEIKREKQTPAPEEKWKKNKYTDDFQIGDEPEEHQAPFMDWRDVRRIEQRYLHKNPIQTEADRWKEELDKLERQREKKKLEAQGVLPRKDDNPYLPKRYNR